MTPGRARGVTRRHKAEGPHAIGDRGQVHRCLAIQGGSGGGAARAHPSGCSASMKCGAAPTAWRRDCCGFVLRLRTAEAEVEASSSIGCVGAPREATPMPRCPPNPYECDPIQRSMHSVRRFLPATFGSGRVVSWAGRPCPTLPPADPQIPDSQDASVPYASCPVRRSSSRQSMRAAATSCTEDWGSDSLLCSRHYKRPRGRVD